MTKSELIQSLARDTGLTQQQAGRVVNQLVLKIASALQRGEDVRITGFGTFRTIGTRERPGRNPGTGDAITIPAGRRVQFSGSAGLLGAGKGSNPKIEPA